MKQSTNQDLFANGKGSRCSIPHRVSVIKQSPLISNQGSDKVCGGFELDRTPKINQYHHRVRRNLFSVDLESLEKNFSTDIDRNINSHENQPPFQELIGDTNAAQIFDERIQINGDQVLSHGDQALSYGDHALSHGDQAFSEGGQTASQGDQALLQVDQALSQVDQALPHVDQTLSQVDQALPQADQALSHGNHSLSDGYQGLSHVGETVSYGYETVSYGGQTASRKGQTVSDGDQTVSQGDEAPLQAEQAPPQGEQVFSKALSQGFIGNTETSQDLVSESSLQSVKRSTVIDGFMGSLPFVLYIGSKDQRRWNADKICSFYFLTPNRRPVCVRIDIRCNPRICEVFELLTTFIWNKSEFKRPIITYRGEILSPNYEMKTLFCSDEKTMLIFNEEVRSDYLHEGTHSGILF